MPPSILHLCNKIPQKDGLPTNATKVLNNMRPPIYGLQRILRFLDLVDVSSLSRTCKTLHSVDEISRRLYEEPFCFSDFDSDLENSQRPDPNNIINSRRVQRWDIFKNSITKSNQSLVHRLTIPDFVLRKDFTWIDKNLPNLYGLDISTISNQSGGKDFKWRDLLIICPGLFSRLTYLSVHVWEPDLDLPKTILSACENLRSLSIRGRPCLDSLPQGFDEDTIHDHLCHLIDGIIQHSDTLEIIELRGALHPLLLAPFCREVKLYLENLRLVTLDVQEWLNLVRMKEHRLPKNKQGKSTTPPDNCQIVDHGSVIKEMKANGDAKTSLPAILVSIYRASQYVAIEPLPDRGKNQLPISFSVIRGEDKAMDELLSDKKGQKVLRFLKEKFDWQPKFIWDPFLASGNPIPDTDIAQSISIIEQLFQSLRNASIPIRLLIGDKPDPDAPSSLFFGLQRKSSTAWLAMLRDHRIQAHLTKIAPLVDELDINYSIDTPKIPWKRTKAKSGKRSTTTSLRPAGSPLLKEESDALEREAQAWKVFWGEYALYFTRLSKLCLRMPEMMDTYDSWRLPVLLELFDTERGTRVQNLLTKGFVEYETKGWNLLLLEDVQGPRVKLVQRRWWRKRKEHPIVFTQAHWEETEGDYEDVVGAKSKKVKIGNGQKRVKSTQESRTWTGRLRTRKG